MIKRFLSATKQTFLTLFQLPPWSELVQLRIKALHHCPSEGTFSCFLFPFFSPLHLLPPSLSSSTSSPVPTRSARTTADSNKEAAKCLDAASVKTTIEVRWKISTSVGVRFQDKIFIFWKATCQIWFLLNCTIWSFWRIALRLKTENESSFMTHLITFYVSLSPF